jgi:hypothetical protein
MLEAIVLAVITLAIFFGVAHLVDIGIERNWHDHTLD